MCTKWLLKFSCGHKETNLDLATIEKCGSRIRLEEIVGREGEWADIGLDEATSLIKALDLQCRMNARSRPFYKQQDGVCPCCAVSGASS